MALDRLTQITSSGISSTAPLTGINITGVITATSITAPNYGDVNATSLNVTGVSTLGITSTTNFTAQQLNVSGVSTFANIIAASAVITGNVSVAGTVTYEDTTNVDSIGVITARSGIIINSGGLQVISGVSTFTSGPVLIGSGTSTGTASQTLQVTGGAYISGNLGVGVTNPSAKFHISGNQFLEGGNYFTANTSGYFFAGNGSYTGGIFAGSSGNLVTIRSPQTTLFENNTTESLRITSTGNIGIGTDNPTARLSVNGTTVANRFTLPYGYVATYKTNNPSTNVFIEGSPNTTDWWLFRDPADANSNWGIYHRNIDSTLSESGEYSVPGNSISFVGSGSPAATIDLANGDLQVKRNIKIGNDNIIQWVEVTPGATEWSWSTQVTSQAITLNPSTIPSTARYVLADVFVTANSSDHQNIVLGRSTLTNEKNWVDTRGQQPSGQFGTLTRQAVTLTYNGEGDGYTPNFGMWYSSQHIPCSGRTIYYNNYGWSGSSGWVYVVVKAYSL
jgi:hypothetical protein